LSYDATPTQLLGPNQEADIDADKQRARRNTTAYYAPPRRGSNQLESRSPMRQRRATGKFASRNRSFHGENGVAPRVSVLRKLRYPTHLPLISGRQNRPIARANSEAGKWTHFSGRVLRNIEYQYRIQKACHCCNGSSLAGNNIAMFWAIDPIVCGGPAPKLKRHPAALLRHRAAKKHALARLGSVYANTLLRGPISRAEKRPRN